MSGTTDVITVVTICSTETCLFTFDICGHTMQTLHIHMCSDEIHADNHVHCSYCTTVWCVWLVSMYSTGKGCVVKESSFDICNMRFLKYKNVVASNIRAQRYACVYVCKFVAQIVVQFNFFYSLQRLRKWLDFQFVFFNRSCWRTECILLLSFLSIELVLPMTLYAQLNFNPPQRMCLCICTQFLTLR